MGLAEECQGWIVAGWRWPSPGRSQQGAAFSSAGFDAIRQAVLLVGGDKTGGARSYLAMVPFAASEGELNPYSSNCDRSSKPEW